jgi:hypothetical protein
MTYLNGKMIGPLSGEPNGYLGGHGASNSRAFAIIPGNGVARRFQYGQLADYPTHSAADNFERSDRRRRHRHIEEKPLNDLPQLAGELRCEGVAGGCQRRRGTPGYPAMYSIGGRNLCTQCAIKYIGVEDLPGGEQWSHLAPFLIKPSN